MNDYLIVFIICLVAMFAGLIFEAHNNDLLLGRIRDLEYQMADMRRLAADLQLDIHSTMSRVYNLETSGSISEDGEIF